MPLRVRLPHVLEILAYDDGPYAREGDSVRLVAAGLAGLVLAFAADSVDNPVLRILLLIAFVPEVFRRMWIAMPQPMT